MLEEEDLFARQLNSRFVGSLSFPLFRFIPDE
jgi:hypothetical protein